MKATIQKPTKTGTLLKLLAYTAGIAGGGVTLLALSAPAGVWVGLWDFRQGFSILRSGQPFVQWIAVFCAAITLLLILLRKKAQNGQASRFIRMAATATVASFVAWYIPDSYLPQSGVSIPPIHDISTDVLNPPQFVDVLALRGENSNPTVYGTGNPNLTPEEHARLQREAYPDVATRVFTEPAPWVFGRALHAVDALGWTLVAREPLEGRIEATDTTFWFRFKDDIVIRVTETPEGTLLDARSTSRVGLSDVGKNAARLRAFMAEL